MSPIVSVVITTKNEEKNIENCLKSIKLQTYKNIEIIVVDNYSNDKTLEIAKKYTNKVYSHGPERSAQRNYGMRDIAIGEYLMYVDADMIITPRVIELAVLHFSNSEKTVGLYLREFILGDSIFNKIRRFERNFYDGTVIDAGRIYRKKIFNTVGGFDEEIFKKGSGEDWDLDKKIKKYGLIEMLNLKPIAKSSTNKSIEFQGIYHNESNLTLWTYLKKKLYYSQGFPGYILKWGKEDEDIKKQFGIKYRYFDVFVKEEKWKILISSIALTTGMYLLKILIGFVYLISLSGYKKKLS